ncbi:MAG TPA: SPFH domain-containing protein, partial [Patescibacteria group bacterium]|nr:SPFH domain-containing protein [Patescibacteria group bacterium]
MFALVFVLLFAIGLIAGPIVSSSLGHDLGAATSAVMVISGIALAIVSGVLMIVAKLYQKTRANEALVRTGMGGMKVIKDGGSIVIPVVHQLVRVPLESIRLEMERKGADGLITGDKLRADIKAEFFVRVMAIDDDIMNASRSLGDKLQNAAQVRSLVEDKLVSALRNAAAKKSLEELNSNRDGFMEEVVKIVTGDLKHNGLTLESVTISKLDQA